MKKYTSYAREHIPGCIAAAFVTFMLVMPALRDMSAFSETSWLDTAPWLTTGIVALVSVLLSPAIVKLALAFYYKVVEPEPEEHREH